MTTKKPEADEAAASAATSADLEHPALDSDPRAGTTDEQNQIDFNDPALTGRQAVEKALASQGE